MSKNRETCEHVSGAYGVARRCNRLPRQGETLCWQHQTRENVQAKLDRGYRIDAIERAVADAERAALERLMDCHDAGMIREFKVLDGLCAEVRSARRALAEAAKP